MNPCFISALSVRSEDASLPVAILPQRVFVNFPLLSVHDHPCEVRRPFFGLSAQWKAMALRSLCSALQHCGPGQWCCSGSFKAMGWRPPLKSVRKPFNEYLVTFSLAHVQLRRTFEKDFTNPHTEPRRASPCAHQCNVPMVFTTRTAKPVTDQEPLSCVPNSLKSPMRRNYRHHTDLNPHSRAHSWEPSFMGHFQCLDTPAALHCRAQCNPLLPQNQYHVFRG